MRPEILQAIEAENRRTFLKTCSLLNPAKRIVLDPSVQAIKRKELPLVMGGQGRSDESASVDGKLLALCVVAVVMGTMAVWAGHAMFQMARGIL
jgi:hypothetical protein